MVDPISRIQFEVYGKENYQRECHVRLLCREPRGRRIW